MDWDSKDCLNLIEAFRLQEVLWDSKNPSYFSKNAKRDAWCHLAKEMKRSVEEIKKKILSFFLFKPKHYVSILKYVNNCTRLWNGPEQLRIVYFVHRTYNMCPHEQTEFVRMLMRARSRSSELTSNVAQCSLLVSTHLIIIFNIFLLI